MSNCKVNTEPFLWSWLVSIERNVSYYGLSGVISVIQADRSLYWEKCAIVFSFCLCLFFFWYLYAATSDNVILHCSPLLATRDYQLWTHRSPLMARSQRGEITLRALQSTEDDVIERLQEKRQFPHANQDRWVSWFLFSSLLQHSFPGVRLL